MTTTEPNNIPLKGAKGGRPKKGAADKRSVRLSAYVTPDEARTIKTKLELAEMSASDFLRDLALGKEISVTVRPSVVKRLRADIGGAMNNINQIARKVNGGEVRDLADTDLTDIYDFLGDRLDQLDEL